MPSPWQERQLALEAVIEERARALEALEADAARKLENSLQEKREMHRSLDEQRQALQAGSQLHPLELLAPVGCWSL